MNKQTMEHLSSLMDGEMSQDTAIFVTRRMSSDAQLGQAWERYHLIRDCLRKSGDDLALCRLSIDLDRLDDAPGTVADAAANGGGRRRAAWLKPVSGFAIAASVAMVAVLLTLDGVAPGTTPGNTPGDEPTQPFASPNPINAGPATQPASFNGQAEARQRLNGYLLRHNRAAGAVGRQGFVSYVPIVTTSALQPGETVADAGAEDDASRVEAAPESPATPQN